MAYNSNKGNQQSGDIQFESDPTDTQIDFENDFVAIKTNAQQRFIVSGSFITSSIPLSCSVGVSAGSLTGDSLAIGGSTVFTVARQLSNVASLDATTESTVEAAIDTLPNLSSVGGSGAELEALGVLDIAQGLKIANSNFVDTNRNITGSGFLSNIGGIKIDTGKVIGTAGDPNLLALNNNELVISGRMQASGSSIMTGSLEISGSETTTTLLKLHKRDADSREIEIFNKGARQSAITLNASEQLFIENESTKDIILRTNNQNTLRVFGQNQRVGIAKEGTSANAELDVDGSAIISGSFTVSGASTLGTIPGHVTQFVGHVSASAGMHITGSNPKLSIGDAGDATPNGGMLFIRPTDTSNRVLAFMQSAEADGRRVCFGVSGSGQVLAGGAHLGGVFNVSGAAAERLVSVKSDTKDPLFYIDGTGPAYLSASQTLKTAVPGLTLSSSTDSDAYARFVLNASKNILVENQTFNKFIVFKTNDGGSIKEGFRIGGSVPEVVVNEGSDSLTDFRVESNTNTHALFVDGSENTVGVGVSDPIAPLDIGGNAVRIRTSDAPSSASDTGAPGEIRWDTNYIYVCVATDTWKRVAISTW